MKRRNFLSQSLAVAAAALLAACGEANETQKRGAPAIIKKRREMRMVTTWPKNFPGLGTSAERLATRIEKASEGAIKIHVFAAGELVPAFGSFDAVSTGAADMYHGAEYYWQGKSPAFAFFTALPFGMTATEHNGWITRGGGQALWDALSAKFNIKAHLAANTGTQMGGWFRKRIRNARDLKGLKIRIPGLGGEVYRRLGASPVTLAGGDIFPSLQSGKIDAAEWIGPWNDLAFGFHRIARFCYYPGFHEPGAALALGVNLDLWKSLPASSRALIEMSSAAESFQSYAEFTHYNAVAMQTLEQDHGVRFLPFPDDIVDSFRRISAEVVREAGKADALSQRIYDSYIKEMARTGAWMGVAEQSIMNARLS